MLPSLPTWSRGPAATPKRSSLPRGLPGAGESSSGPDVHAELAGVREEADVACEEEPAHGAVRSVGDVVLAMAALDEELRAGAEAEGARRVAEEPRVEADARVAEGVGVRTEVDREGRLRRKPERVVADGAALALDRQGQVHVEVQAQTVIGRGEAEVGERLVGHDRDVLCAVRDSQAGRARIRSSSPPRPRGRRACRGCP